MSAALANRWRDWSARFAALQQREKLMVAGATAFAILFGGYSLWIEPAEQRKTRLQKTIEQQKVEQEQLRVQLLALAAQRTDPDAANRAQLEQLRKQIADTERDIRDFDRLLVAPTQAPALLQTLLTRHRGLTLVSLNTLPPEPLIAPPKTDSREAGAQPTVEQAGGNIYKHGIEIRISGGYHELLAYVSELEGSPQRLLWGGMSLVAGKHPVSQLTLTVYTLSLESTWLVV